MQIINSIKIIHKVMKEKVTVSLILVQIFTQHVVE